MANQERLINDFCDLVRIDSPSGEEWDVALQVSDRLSTSASRLAAMNTAMSSPGRTEIVPSFSRHTWTPWTPAAASSPRWSATASPPTVIPS